MKQENLINNQFWRNKQYKYKYLELKTKFCQFEKQRYNLKEKKQEILTLNHNQYGVFRCCYLLHLFFIFPFCFRFLFLSRAKQQKKKLLYMNLTVIEVGTNNNYIKIYIRREDHEICMKLLKKQRILCIILLKLVWWMISYQKLFIHTHTYTQMQKESWENIYFQSALAT